MQLGWMKQTLVTKKKIYLSPQNEGKHIHEDFTESHSLTLSQLELIKISTIYFFSYHSTGQQVLYVFYRASTTRRLLTSVIVSKSEPKINKCVRKFRVGAASV